MNRREAVEIYWSQGWACTPIASGEKGPTGASWPDKAVRDRDRVDFSSFEGSGNIGVLLGEVSGDLVDVDLDCPEALSFADAILPATLTFGRPGNPRSHRLFISKGANYRKRTTDKTLIELRCAPGTQTVFPPSIHPSGQIIEFVEPLMDPVEIDSETLGLMVDRIAAGAALRRVWPAQGSGGHTCDLALAGALVAADWSDEDAIAFLDLVGAQNASREVSSSRAAEARKTSWGKLKEILGSDLIAKVMSWLGIEGAAAACTDMGNADRFVLRNAGALKYCHGLGWLSFQDNRWHSDDLNLRREMAKETARGIFSECARAADKARRIDASEADLSAEKKLRAWGVVSQGKARIDAMIDLAESDPSIAVSVEAFDRDPWLLNCGNGVLDLRVGACVGGEGLFSKVAGTDYVAGAVCPTWTAFLEKVLPDVDVREFLRRYMGYCLSGIVSEDCLVFFHGAGGNGKSVFVQTIMAVFGDYAAPAAPGLLMSRKNEAHPTELLDLRGVRLSTATEVDEGARWDEPRLKELTGRDQIKARAMRQDFISFSPTHKFVVSGNYRPAVRGTDRGIWRRLKLVPWEVSIPDQEADRTLSTRLRSELPGILTWAVGGCLAWQESGLREPVMVTEATDTYRNEVDTVGSFIMHECTIGLGDAVTIPTQQLYERFCIYLSEAGIRYQPTLRKFSNECIRLGLETRHTRKGSVWAGVRIGATH